WFMAFTLQNAAYVKALGQVELVFTFLASWLVFKETSTGREIAGILLVVSSILLLILAF
ncbi:MAG: EamA family transporter, partial [Alphaproteobacteria bacterium]|nr:EamA family transporter [Alphaproteobacteria bacterium]